MENKRAKIKAIPEPLYHSWIRLWVGGKIENAERWFKEHTGIECEPHERPPDGCVMGHQGYYLVFFNGRPDSGLLAHEAVHLAWSILENAGMKIEDATEEALCYLTQYLVDEIIKRV